MKDNLSPPNLGAAPRTYDYTFFHRALRAIEIILSDLLSKGPVRVSTIEADSITATGDVTANKFHGDGSELTNLPPADLSNVTTAITFNRTLSSSNLLLDLQQGYRVLSDNVGSSGASNRLWVDGPISGQMVFGPRTGSSYLANLTVKATTVNFDTGAVTASSFAGSGTGLTSLNASNLSTGTIPDARFPATLPAASGANLTALNASNLSSGTVPNARFPATLPAASGANLTALNASNLSSGTIPDARFPATLPEASGANLTNLIAANLIGNYPSVVSVKGNSAGSAATAYVRFLDSNEVRSGFVGKGSSTNNDIYVLSDSGGVRLSGTFANVNGSEIYRRDNIIGTVSQSGGVPTGAIVQQGSNANGSYTRFADGTQICWHSFAWTLAASTSTTTTWVSPAAFSELPRTFIDVNNVVTTNGFVSEHMFVTSALSSLPVRARMSAAQQYVFNVMAVGRWY